MKKHLIAAAVAAAVAVPAMAQVTIGGTIDMSYDFGDRTNWTSGDGRGSDANGLTSGLLTTSDLKLSGSEDLGGGLKAFFQINSGLNRVLNSDCPGGCLNDLNYNEGSVITFGDRGALIGIQGSFGSIAVGKTTGTAINALRGGVAGNLSLLNAGSFEDDADRPTNVIDYTSPAFNGVTARVIYQLGENDDGVGNRGDSEISFAYANGPLTAGIAFQNADGDSDIGARVTYNFGPAAVNFSFQDIEGQSSNFYSLGVTVPVDAISFFAEYQDRPDVKTRINLGAVYNLSKRTNVYFVYSDDKENASANDNQSAESVMAVGIRHSF
jgi:predicted porin